MFVCQENVVRMRRSLEAEIDSARRSIVTQILVAEESKLGFTLEQLDDVNQYIGRCRELIGRQEDLLHQLESSGRDTAQARGLLITLTQSLALHEHHRSSRLTFLICHSRPQVPLRSVAARFNSENGHG